PEARLQHCIGVAWHEGFVYVADTYNHKIKRLDPKTRDLSTFLGTGQPGTADGPRASAQLNEPNGLCFVGDTMYIADSNNHLLRACHLADGQVRTLSFTGLEKLTRKMPSSLSGQEIKLPLARVSPKAEALTLEVMLPAGTKLNLSGPSKLKSASADARIVDVGDFKESIQGTRIAVPIRAKPGQTTVTLEADVYYCSKANEGLCYFKWARLLLPVVVAEEGSANPRVEFRMDK